MADNSIVRELLEEIDIFEHTKVAQHISRLAEISLKYFDNSGLSSEYFLDLDDVFIKNKQKLLKFHTPNPDHIFEIFGKYSHEDANVVRASVIDYITCDPVSFNEHIIVVLTMLHLSIDEWLLQTKDPKWHCDIHLVFLEGGVLGQLHKKPSILRLMAVTGLTPKNAVGSHHDETVPSNSDHTYLSPSPRPIPATGAKVNQTNDHTYAEDSDVPTEPYGSNTDSKLDNVSNGVTSEERLVIASTDKLEISVEYSNSASLLEKTGTTQNASEMLLDTSNAGIIQPNLENTTKSVLQDETTDNKALLEATNVTEQQNTSLSDETPKTLPDKPNETSKLLPDEPKGHNVAPEATNC